MQFQSHKTITVRMIQICMCCCHSKLGCKNESTTDRKMTNCCSGLILLLGKLKTDIQVKIQH